MYSIQCSTKKRKLQSAKRLVLLDQRTTNTGVVHVVALGARVCRGDLALLSSAITARLPLTRIAKGNTGGRNRALEEIW